MTQTASRLTFDCEDSNDGPPSTCEPTQNVHSEVVEELKSESEKSSHRGRIDRRQWTAIDVRSPK